MKSFHGVSRVQVIDAESPLFGKTGTVHRRLIRDDSAWINMDECIPDELASFPDGDPRRNHIQFYPEQCEPA